MIPSWKRDWIIWAEWWRGEMSIEDIARLAGLPVHIVLRRYKRLRMAELIQET